MPALDKSKLDQVIKCQDSLERLHDLMADKDWQG